jgi:small subunit ribosomal protein S17
MTNKKQTTQSAPTPVKRKTLRGTVMSNKMKDTIVVAVENYEQHPKYKKYLLRRKRFMVHDPGNTKQVGELVTIEECRPLSRHKHFVVKA